MSNNFEHIYYDVNYTNISDKIVDINFIQSRNEPILKNPSNYYLSVIRFTIPNKTIPIFRYPTKIINNVEIPDDTKFSVTITVNNNNNIETHQKFVLFEQTTFLNGYDKFGIYSYNNFLLMINTALASAWIEFTNFTPSELKQPYFVYNEESNGLLSLRVTYPKQDDAFLINIYMNHELQSQYFQNFQGIINGIDTINLKDFEFPTYDFYSPIIISENNNYITYEWKQEVVSIASWNAIRAIIIQSSKLPTRQDLLNGSSINTENTTSNIRQLITDFEPLGSGQDSRSRYQYYPQGEYRLLDMLSEQPITDLDIKVLWEDKFQNLYPVKLDIGSFLSIKLMFISKDFYHFSKIENLDWKKMINNKDEYEKIKNKF